MAKLPFNRIRIKNTYTHETITPYISFVIQLSSRYLQKFVVNTKRKTLLFTFVPNITLLNGDAPTISAAKFSFYSYNEAVDNHIFSNMLLIIFSVKCVSSFNRMSKYFYNVLRGSKSMHTRHKMLDINR